MLKAIASALFIAIATQASAGPLEVVDLDHNRLLDRYEIATFIVWQVRARDRDGDMQLSYGEMIFRDLDGPDPIRRDKAALIMSTFDPDRNGKVSIYEVLSTLMRGRVFEQTDANKDGYISTREAQAKGFLLY